MWPSKKNSKNPPDLDVIRADAEAVTDDTEAKAEAAEFAEREESRIHRQVMHRLLEHAALNENNQREKLGKNILYVIMVWLFIVLSLFIVDALKLYGFNQSDEVMMVLLGTTTANIIGLLVIVLQYFYRSSSLEVYFKSSSNTE